MANQRPRLDDILSGGSGFDDLWNTTDAAGEFQPIPSGVYRCLVADGKLSEAKTGTPSFKVTFEVLDGDHAGRKVFHDLWLTPKALPTSKRDLAKLGIRNPADMRRPLPSGLVAEVKVALRSEDDGSTFNRVVAFKVLDEAPTVDPLAPDEDDLDPDEDDEDFGSHEDVRRFAERVATARGELFNPDAVKVRAVEADAVDDDGFDWQAGEQRGAKGMPRDAVDPDDDRRSRYR
ncbi:DUF669 domain-containing protein [Tautonia rosea]|uniref:DUF669 domain-containing protein n=1 Tax=Tautonia rosea TaxID=2728037 RepID=UPI00147331BF|nr:DUF669 domain-containing protein [Tautonia rosea]